MCTLLAVLGKNDKACLGQTRFVRQLIYRLLLTTLMPFNLDLDYIVETLLDHYAV